jgi:methylthioribose-1-phosphate isomerase
VRTIEWHDGVVKMIDQQRLPRELIVLEFTDYRGVADAIRSMKIRGAPAIGAAAAFGLALAVAHHRTDTNRKMGAHGAALLATGDNVLTHCNAGALATVDYGTTLGVVRAAHEEGKHIHVWVDETRPFLQGARLTAWELHRDGIPCTLITDNMAGHFMSRGRVDIVLVGADRIAANGDVANKIGTYSLAVLAHENGIPFYSVAPKSTVDLGVATGASIPIEERDPAEVTHIGGQRVAAEGVDVANPAFDVTPHRYVTGIVTESGIIYPPFSVGLRRAKAA